MLKFGTCTLTTLSSNCRFQFTFCSFMIQFTMTLRNPRLQNLHLWGFSFPCTGFLSNLRLNPCPLCIAICNIQLISLYFILFISFTTYITLIFFVVLVCLICNWKSETESTSTKCVCCVASKSTTEKRVDAFCNDKHKLMKSLKHE